MAVDLVYETHSITTDNESGHATGWLPGELSETGRRFAADLGRRHRDDGTVAVYASDLRRAVETAEIAFDGSGIPIHTDARLREVNYGDWNGMPVSRLEAERSARIDTPFPGGQSYREVVTQTADLLRELALKHDGERIVLIGHSATRHALNVLLQGARLEDLVDAPFKWREGWEYVLPAGWTLSLTITGTTTTKSVHVTKSDC
ncbi:histidine phosphatase family protein [Hamadaea tsunoensis]|uniref:histidine phosphatase family protein n=1 Tax=Hamadaea tsunoensis TaxID=53368 RepID=UPI0006873D7B|nr:histidine phosphatase family protein [Hamadaea tsunoensis]